MSGGGGSYKGFGSEDIKKYGGPDNYHPGSNYDPYKKNSIFAEKTTEDKEKKSKKKRKKRKHKKSSSSDDSSDDSDKEDSDKSSSSEEEEQAKPSRYKKKKAKGLTKPKSKNEAPASQPAPLPQ